MTSGKLMAFFVGVLIASAMLAALEGGANECDSDCEVEQALKCWVLCQ
jgi:hypothetical protein